MNRKNQKGFTLIELILYIALISIFMTGAVYFAWDVIYGREKAFQQQIVEQSANIALSRIGYEIRNATDIQSITDTQLILGSDGLQITIELNGDRLQITTGGLGPYFLTSNQARVTNSSVFEDLSSTSYDSKSIGVTLTVEQGQTAVPGQYQAVSVLESSFELNSQFNQSRSLLVDLSNASFTALSIEGITIQNSQTDDIIIDKLDVSWSGSAGGENITNVQIGSGVEEWSGSEPSGTVLELTDFNLASSDGVVDVDYLTFDSDITGAIVTMGFIMSDGSTVFGNLEILSSGTPVPTPTDSPVPTPTDSPVPTPTDSPVGTCNEYCINALYSSGTCRKNAKTCRDNGETYESEGDQYCTGGPSSDTCCCAP